MYGDLEAFKQDLDLIWNNCFTYNKDPNSDVCLMARELQALAEARLERIPHEIEEKRGRLAELTAEWKPQLEQMVATVNDNFATYFRRFRCVGEVTLADGRKLNPTTGELEEKDVHWFKTDFSRHVLLANEDCELGAPRPERLPRARACLAPAPARASHTEAAAALPTHVYRQQCASRRALAAIGTAAPPACGRRSAREALPRLSSAAGKILLCQRQQSHAALSHRALSHPPPPPHFLPVHPLRKFLLQHHSALQTPMGLPM